MFSRSMPAPRSVSIERGEERPVGHGTRDVADQDAGAFPAPGRFRERMAPHRPFQRLPHRPYRVVEGLHRMLADYRGPDAVRQAERKGAPSV